MVVESMQRDNCIFVQISDLHICKKGTYFNEVFDTTAALEHCIDSINKLHPIPDFVLATGDLANEPNAESYKIIHQKLQKLNMPVFVMPGNHDDRKELCSEFEDAYYLNISNSFLSYCIEKYPLRLIALDSLNAATGEGEVCQKRLDWLEKKLLEEPTKPTLLAMHHQPIFTRLGSHGQKYAFDGAKELEELLAYHSQVLWITCGHLHRQIIFCFGKIPVTVAPSATCIRTLTMDNSMPKELINEPPGYLLFIWEQKAGIICHNNVVGNFNQRHQLL